MNDFPVVRFTSLAYGGEALGRLEDGRAVFAPFLLPGESARVRLVEEKRGYARAEVVERLDSAPQRIAPRCLHFGECGGCHYQHLAYPDQLAAKRAILRDQLERIGGLVDPPVASTVASPTDYGYRNYIQFHLTAGGDLGYYLRRSDQVFAVRECHLPEQVIGEVWPQLEFDAFNEIERVGVRAGMDNDVQLVLESRILETPELTVEGLPVSVVHLSPAGALVLAGGSRLAMQVLGRTFYVSADSFFQVNTAMAGAMVAHLLEQLPLLYALDENVTLLDVYCGAGLFSAFLAERVSEVIGIESSPSACGDYAVNLDEFDNVSLYEAPAETVLDALEARQQVVIVDPPRAGIQPKALDGLLRLAPEVIAYVSCDPSTLARDARRLQAGGYRLEQVTPFDLFPQTYHIESVSFWMRTA